MTKDNILKNKLQLMKRQLGGPLDCLLPLNTLVLSDNPKNVESAFIEPKIKECNTNYVITDTSGKYYQKYAKFLEGNGYTVRKLDFNDMNDSCMYNPIEYLRTEADFFTITRILKNTFFTGEDNFFFEKTKEALLRAVISYVAIHEPDPAKRNFARVYELIASAKSDSDKDDFKQAFEGVKAFEPYSFAAAQYEQFCQLATEKTRDSDITELLSQMSLFKAPNIKALTAIDELDLHDFEDKKLAIFICIPCEDTTYNFLALMLYTQIYRLLEKYISDSCPEHSLPRNCQFIMDKFPDIGKFELLAEMMYVGQKDGIICSIICESIEQLTDIYEKEFNVIVSNCPVKILLHTASETTAEWAADVLCEGEINASQLMHMPENEYIANIQYAYRKFLKCDTDL